MGKYDFWIGLLVTIAIAAGFFLQPDIRPLEICPNYVDDSFNIRLTNYGETNADTCVESFSPLIAGGKKCGLVVKDMDKYTHIELKINKSALLAQHANISINYTYEYAIYLVWPKKFGAQCNYAYETGFPLRLIPS